MRSPKTAKTEQARQISYFNQQMRKIGIETEFDKQAYQEDYGARHTTLFMKVPKQDNLPQFLKVGERIRLDGYSDMTNYKVHGDVLPILQKRVNEEICDYKVRTKQFVYAFHLNALSVHLKVRWVYHLKWPYK